MKTRIHVAESQLPDFPLMGAYDFKRVRGAYRMRCIRRRETNGHQKTSNECAPATAIHSGPGCGRNPAGYSERTTCTGTDPETRGACEAVSAQSGPGSGSSSAARGRGVGCFI